MCCGKLFLPTLNTAVQYYWLFIWWLSGRVWLINFFNSKEEIISFTGAYKENKKNEQRKVVPVLNYLNTPNEDVWRSGLWLNHSRLWLWVETSSHLHASAPHLYSWNGGSMGPRASLDSLYRNPSLPVQPIAHCYTKWDILAPE